MGLLCVCVLSRSLQTAMYYAEGRRSQMIVNLYVSARIGLVVVCFVLTLLMVV